MVNREEQLKYGIALGLVNGLGTVRAKSLIGYCGGTKEVFNTKLKELMLIPGVGEIAAREIIKFKDFDAAEKEVEFVKTKGIEAIFYFDKEYPVRLKICNDSPIVLFTHNNKPLHSRKVISIIGTRNATDYGKRFVREIVEQLSEYDVTVVSGLAYGIDIEAHKACVDNKVKNMAVVAHGLDRVYPAIHKKVYNQMREMDCGMVSEFLTGTIPNRENFPKRNRIIAGLADATIVVESDIKGGSMITAELAHGYNRELFALPGSIYSQYSSGCNKLLKTNKAYCIEGIGDLIYHLGWEINPENRKIQKQLFVELSPQEQIVIDCLKEKEYSIDQLYLKTEIPMSKLALLLLDLEFNGQLFSMPGKKYKLA